MNNQQANDLQLLTVKQAAAVLGCSQTNVYALIGSGTLPVVPIGRSKGYRIDPRDLDGFVQSRKVRFQAPQTAKKATKLKHIRL